MQHYDIMIVGGGLVGASLALCLQQAAGTHDWKIGLIEPYAPQDDYQPSYDTRSSAIAYGSSLIYQQLGIWDVLSKHAEPITQVEVSEAAHCHTVNLYAKEEQVPALGYVMDNAWLGQCLLGALDTQLVECLYNTQVADLMPSIAGYEVVLDTGQHFSSSLVVLADGGRSDLREQLGIYVKKTPYDQTAIIANVTPSYRHNGRAFERFTEQGPMALLPLENNRAALVWTRPHDEAARLMALFNEQFITELQKAFGGRMGEFKQVGIRYSYPLVLTMAEEQVRPHLVLLGNSAHGMHPVAGQGYNLSLRDTWCLAKTLIDSEKPLGDLAVLMSYVKKREQDQCQVVHFSDQLIHLFSNNKPFLKAGRRLGLFGLAAASPLKHWFAKQAMGLGTDQ